MLLIQILRIKVFGVSEEHFSLVIFVVLRKNLLDASSVILRIYALIDFSESVVQE